MECAHETCTCLVIEEGEFCSESCEIGTMSGGFCGCDHASCQGVGCGAGHRPIVRRLSLVAGATVGATIVYLFDPVQGRRRRRNVARPLSIQSTP